MLVHSVYFWLKDGLDQAQLDEFERGLTGLRAIRSVHALYVGRPVESDRPVVQSGYSFGLTILFDDADALQAYQVDPLHQAFVQNYSRWWAKVVVYDFA